jgi:hypothetical protein
MFKFLICPIVFVFLFLAEAPLAQQHRIAGHIKGLFNGKEQAFDMVYSDSNIVNTYVKNPQYVAYLIESEKKYYFNLMSSSFSPTNNQGENEGDVFYCSTSVLEIDKMALPTDLSANVGIIPSVYCQVIRYVPKEMPIFYTSYPLKEDTLPLKVTLVSMRNGYIKLKVSGNLYRMSLADQKVSVVNEAFSLEDVRIEGHLTQIPFVWRPRGIPQWHTMDLQASHFLSEEDVQQWDSVPLSAFERHFVGAWKSRGCAWQDDMVLTRKREFMPKLLPQGDSPALYKWRYDAKSEQVYLIRQTQPIFNLDTNRVEKWWHEEGSFPIGMWDLPTRIVQCSKATTLLE